MRIKLENSLIIKYEANCWIMREDKKDGKGKDTGNILGYYTKLETAVKAAHDRYLGGKRIETDELQKTYDKYSKKFFEKLVIESEAEVDGE